MSSKQFLRAVIVSVLGTGVSRVLGALRDATMAAVFGRSAQADAFVFALTVPNVFRRFVADEGLSGAVLPALAHTESDTAQYQRQQRELVREILGFLVITNSVLCLLGLSFPALIVQAVLMSSGAEVVSSLGDLGLIITMTQALFVLVAAFSAVSMAESLLNHRGHFLIPKVAPGLLSLGMIIGALFANSAGALWAEVIWGIQPIWWAVVGALLGGLAHALLTIPWVVSYWGWLWPSFRFRHPELRRVAIEMAKVIAIGIFGQLNILVLRGLAFSVETGALTMYQNANRIVDLAQGMVAVAVGGAILPRLSRAVAENSREKLAEELGHGMSLLFFVLMPATALLMSFSQPVVVALFGRGAYDIQATTMTTYLVIWLSPFLLASGASNVLKRVYFATAMRWRLMAFGAIGLMLTWLLGSYGIRHYGLGGLAAALSLSTFVQASLLLGGLYWVMGASAFIGVLRTLLGAWRFLPGSAVVGVLGWWASRGIDWPERNYGVQQFLLLALVGLALGLSYLLISRLVAPKETRRLLSR